MAETRPAPPGLAEVVVDGFGTQLRVIQALMLREIKTRFGRERLGYLWAFIEPSLYVLVFVSLLSFRNRPIPGGMHIVTFMITGIVPFMLFSGTVNRSIGAIFSNRTLLFFPQVKMLDFFIARLALEFLTWLVVFIVLCMGASAAGIEVKVQDPLGVVFWIFTASMLAFGFGMLFGIISPLWPTLERLIPHIFIRPLFFTSGIFFTADMLPTELREVVLINGLLHISEMLRSSFFVGFESPYGDINYVWSQIIATVGASLILIRAFRVRILAAIRD